MTSFGFEPQGWQLVGLILEYVIKIIAIGLVPEGQKPSSSSAWLLAILFVPVIGLPLWFLAGSPFINARRHEVQIDANRVVGNALADRPPVPEDAPVGDEIASLIRLNHRLTGMPAVWSHHKQVLSDYEGSLRRMAEAIDQAQRFVLAEVYIISWDDTTDVFFRAMERAAARGVHVCVLFDQVGSWKYPGYLRLGRRLTAIGVEWHLTQPLAPWKWRFRRPDLRNHRKMVIVDGETGFMGSQNVIDPTYLVRANVAKGRRWVDCMVELNGSVVASMATLFAVDWYLETGEVFDIADLPVPDEHREASRSNLVQLVPSGPGYLAEPNLKMFNSIVHHAKHTLVMCSPYFIPDESLLEAVNTACYRGVDVHLFVNEESDQFMVGHAQASYYRGLLDAGVTIHLYPAPYVLHTKFMLADPQGPNPIGVLGSSNMDMRSFGLNYEVSLMVTTGKLLTELDALAWEYARTSRVLTREEWSERSLSKRYVDNVMRLTSALQ